LSIKQVIEPENALPEVAIEALPERIRVACASAGWLKTVARPGPGDSLYPRRTEPDGPVTDGERKDRGIHPADLERVDMAKKACQILVLVPTVSWPFRSPAKQNSSAATSRWERLRCMAA